MGRLQAEEMAQIGDLDAALTWHLRCNHYPPVPLRMVQTCKDAIEACNALEWDKEIDLPSGTTYRGRASAPASEIVRGHHLEPFLADDENYE